MRNAERPTFKKGKKLSLVIAHWMRVFYLCLAEFASRPSPVAGRKLSGGGLAQMQVCALASSQNVRQYRVKVSAAWSVLGMTIRARVRGRQYIVASNEPRGRCVDPLDWCVERYTMSFKLDVPRSHDGELYLVIVRLAGFSNGAAASNDSRGYR